MKWKYHENRSDVHGSLHIDTNFVGNLDLSRCARRLIITIEEITYNQLIHRKKENSSFEPTEQHLTILGEEIDLVQYY